MTEDTRAPMLTATEHVLVVYLRTRALTCLEAREDWRTFSARLAAVEVSGFLMRSINLSCCVQVILIFNFNNLFFFHISYLILYFELNMFWYDNMWCRVLNNIDTQYSYIISR